VPWLANSLAGVFCSAAGFLKMSDTVPCTITVRSISPVTARRLVGLAAVAIEIDGFEIVLQGLQILRNAKGAIGIGGPTHKGPNGVSFPSVVLPDELSDANAVAEVVFAEFKERQRAGRSIAG
jgi:hypothetical protein